jgi:hypothetical protein
MNQTEALAILREALDEWRRRSYAELVAEIGNQKCSDVIAPSGTGYQIEIETIWDDRRDGNIRVLGAIDDYGSSVYSPLTDDFIMSPDGSFVGE